jgi:hypothetical protein
MGVADRRGRGDPSPPSEDLHLQGQAAKPSVQFGGKSVGRAGLTCPWRSLPVGAARAWADKREKGAPASEKPARRWRRGRVAGDAGPTCH